MPPEPESPPELRCVCMGEQVSHSLEPCGHRSFCRTCAMLLCSGAVVGHGAPQRPLCRAGRWAAAHGHTPIVDRLPKRRVVSSVGNGTQHADERVNVPVGLEDTSGYTHLSAYRGAVVRDSNLPALLGTSGLERRSAVIRCRTGEIWSLDDEGCPIKPKGNHVHLQMKKGRTGHWYLPVGRFGEAMNKLGQGHLAATTATPANDSAHFSG